MNDAPRSPRKIWFPAKTYGWGWGPPICWQGWVVVAVFFAALAGGAALIPRGPRHAPVFVGYAFALSFVLCLVCWWKGETPKWRWGDKKPR